MMYFYRKPSGQQITDFIKSQSSLDYTYPSIGATRKGENPPRFVVDHTRIRIGSGQATFEAAKQSLLTWQHYKFDWIELHRPEVRAKRDQVVGVLARACGLWVLNACRIVYVLDEETPLRRFAFAYGTLPGHAESGEERFQVEWDHDDSVWYDIFAFSRPNQWLSRMALPYVRWKQKQFAKESTLSMKTRFAKTSHSDADSRNFRKEPGTACHDELGSQS